MRHIIDILRGANTQKIRDFNHGELSTYGICKDLSVDEWQRLGRALLHQGLLGETQDGYSILKLNRASVEILKKLRTFELAAPPPSSTQQRGERDKADLLQNLSAAELDLFQQLRMLRKKLADELNVPPYAIFPDSSLHAMVLRRPQDQAHFAGISGVGSSKLTAYGAAFTAVIREYCLAHNMEMDLEPAKEAYQQQTRSNTISMTQRLTLDFYRAGKSIQEIALERNIKPSTVLTHLTELIEAGETIDITPLIPPGHYDIIVAALNQVGFAGGQATPLPPLRPIKELLGDDFSYDEIKLVRAYLRNESGK
jgi:ATP-dependent DNA helicase RecQ